MRPTTQKDGVIEVIIFGCLCAGLGILYLSILLGSVQLATLGAFAVGGSVGYLAGFQIDGRRGGMILGCLMGVVVGVLTMIFVSLLGSIRVT